MVELFAGTLFIAYSDDISSKKTILFVSFIIYLLSSLSGGFEINIFCLRVDSFSNSGFAFTGRAFGAWFAEILFPFLRSLILNWHTLLLYNKFTVPSILEYILRRVINPNIDTANLYIVYDIPRIR